jgi:hypothetical protein
MASSPQIFLNTLDREGFAAALTTHANLLKYAYCEAETRTDLLYYQPHQATFPDWAQGRAFGAKLELRWRRDDLQYEVQALCEDHLPGLGGWQHAPMNARLDAAPRERLIRLAGVNVSTLPPNHALYDAKGGAWVDPRLPRLLAYPTEDKLAERLRLRCLDYTVMGYTVLTRMVELVR